MKRALIWCAVSSKTQAGPGAVSLGVQEQAAQAKCDAEGWRIIDTFRIAYSRNYKSVEEWAESLYRSNNDDSGRKLFQMWKACAFDVLIAHSLDRLGSTTSMIARIVEETVDTGAIIFISQEGTTINRANAAAMLAIGGFFTSTRRNHLQSKRREAMEQRAANGAPVGPYPHVAYTVKKGLQKRDDRLVIVEERRHWWHDLAVIALEGLDGYEMDYEMYKRFGHVSPTTGKPWAGMGMWKLLHNPIAWGNTAIGVRTQAHGTARRGDWTFDETAEVPQGVKIWRGTHEPLWAGEEAEALKTELRRRSRLPGGKTTARSTHPFSGLLVCASCGHYLCYAPAPHPAAGRDAPLEYYRCFSAYRPQVACTNRTLTPMPLIVDAVNALLAGILAEDDPDAFFRAEQVATQATTRAQVEAEISTAESRLSALIEDKLTTRGESAHKVFQSKIDIVEGQIRAFQKRLESLTEESRDNQDRRRAIEILRNWTLETLWQHPAWQINQVLHMALGDWRLKAQGKEPLVLIRVARPRL